MSSTLRVNKIEATDSNTNIILSGNVYSETLIPKNGYGYHLRQVVRHWTTDGFSSDNGAIDEYTTWPAISCLANSKIQFYVYIPVRNSNGGWGGFHFHPNVRVKLSGNNYTEWMTFGGSGYVTAMESGNDHYDNWTKLYWFDPHDFFPDTRTTDFDIQIQYSGRSYDGTVYVNMKDQSDLNNTTGLANGSPTLISSDTLQNYHWMEIVYYEYASKRGL